LDDGSFETVGSCDSKEVGNTLGWVVGNVLGPTEGIIEGNALGSDERVLLGLNDGHNPHVALHVWKTPFLEHLFLIFLHVFSFLEPSK